MLSVLKWCGRPCLLVSSSTMIQQQQHQTNLKELILDKPYFQILGLFYIMIAAILVGTNCGKEKRAGGEDMKQTVQIMKGKDVKCELMGDNENFVFLEEDV